MHMYLVVRTNAAIAVILNYYTFIKCIYIYNNIIHVDLLIIIYIDRSIIDHQTLYNNVHVRRSRSIQYVYLDHI